MTLVQIDYLADKPELALGLIPGLLDHWRELFPEQTWFDRAEKFRAHMNRDALPLAWVAHDGETVAGTAALRMADLDGREELWPWLGGVYVLPAFRRRGIASRLCCVVEDKARALGFQQIFLFTLDQQSLYAGLGWRTLEATTWKGRAAEIMFKTLADGQGLDQKQIIAPATARDMAAISGNRAGPDRDGRDQS